MSAIAAAEPAVDQGHIALAPIDECPQVHIANAHAGATLRLQIDVTTRRKCPARPCDAVVREAFIRGARLRLEGETR